jgi:hypothetical protein
LPTRVAVGFTPGDEDPNKPGTYHVRGMHAHAWPEVYLYGQGWVPFEPTPTRGAPNAQQYTNVPEQQATQGGGATTVPTTSLATTPTTAGSSGTTTPRNEAGPDNNLPTATEPSFWSTRRFGGRALIAGAVLLVLAIIYVLTVPILYAVYRRRRRKVASEPDAQVRLAWQESVEAAQTLGVSPWRSETAAEFGDRADRAIGAQEFPVLAGLVSAADYSADGVNQEQAATARGLSDEVTQTVRSQTTRQQRVLTALDPRPPERRSPTGRRHRAGPSVDRLPAIEIVRVPSSSN